MRNCIVAALIDAHLTIDGHLTDTRLTLALV